VKNSQVRNFLFLLIAVIVVAYLVAHF